MTASLSGVFNVQQFTDAGLPAASHRLYTYAPGTTTQKVAYTDAAASIPHTYTSDGIGGLYIALNARGELPAPLFFTSGGYDLALKTPAGVTVWTRRAVGTDDVGAALSTTLAGSAGSSLVGHIAAGVGATATTVQKKLRDTTTIYEYGGDSSGAADSRAAVAAAQLDSSNLLFTAGTWRISSNITITSGCSFVSGAKLSIDIGVVVAFSGPVFAGLSQIISGLGTVTFAAGSSTLLAAPQWWGAATANTAAVNTLALQAWLNACQSSGVVAWMTDGSDYTHTGLALNPIFGGISQLPINILGPGYDGNGGNGGAILRVSGTSSNITLNNVGVNTDNLIRIEGISLFGDSTVNPSLGGCGIKATKCNNLHIKFCWIQNHQADGIRLTNCYGSTAEKNTIVGNARWGVFISSQFNAARIVNNKILNNGKTFSQLCGNLFVVGGVGFENLGAAFLDNDTSYAGVMGALYKRSDASLTSITVAAGVATVITAAAHGRATSDQIAIYGAVGATQLNTIFPPTITVTTTTQFTFPTVAANGTYTEATLVIGPPAYGNYIDTSFGCIFTIYCEDCVGPAAYIGANANSWRILSGYSQGVVGSGLVVIDNATSGDINCVRFSGAFAGISHLNTVRPHGIDIGIANSVIGGASITHASLKLVGGTYYSDSVPASGTWTANDVRRVVRLTPAVGSPKGWMRTVDGTPGTWVSEGNL